MGLFQKNQNQQGQMPSQRQLLEGRYRTAGINVLWVVLFTVINIVLLVINSNTYFLFSAFIPYALVDLGMYYCGKYPAEWYEELGQHEFADTSLLVILIVIAAVMCCLYLFCCLFCRKGDKRRVGWLITALVFIALDTGLMLLLGSIADNILNVVFHGWIIVSLIMGISAHFKLKKLPEEEPVVVPQPEAETTEETVSAELPQE
jgi:hypothetical protein